MRRFVGRLGWPILLALAIGVANALLLIGSGPINPTNIRWIFGDNGTYFSGWEQYRHDTHLHFPLTWTERVGYPIGTSIALMDAIPLAAVLLRPLSPVLPEPFQYLGLWVTLCFVLQAYFAFSLCRRLFHEDPLFSAIGSVFFVLAAPLTFRAFGHTALVSQWLILAALDSYFRDPAAAPVRWLARLWIVAAIAAAVTPYLAAMCLLIALAGVVRLRAEDRCGWLRALQLAIVTVAVSVAGGAAFGSLVTGEPQSLWAPGYGVFSWNLDSLVNPLDYGSILLPRLPIALPQQYEGYSYLGLGMIALLVLNLVRRPGALSWLLEPRILVLAGLVIVCAALAASTRVTFGRWTVFELPVPHRLLAPLGTLRASGRLFWPAFYLIYVAGLALTFWSWKAPVRHAILAAALVVQIADVMPLRAKVRDACDHRFDNPTQSAAWTNLGQRYANVVLIPAYQCNPATSAGGPYSFVFFGKLAAGERMRLNSYYAARYRRAELTAHCVDILRTQLEGTLDPQSAYVVSDGVRAVWDVEGMTTHRCQAADGFNLCTTDTPASAVAPIAPASRYQLGDVLDFTHADGNARTYETFGWSDATAMGTWTEGPLAMLRLGVETPASDTRPLTLEVTAQPLVVPSHPQVDVDVTVNRVRVAEWVYRAADAGVPRRVDIPPDVARLRPELAIAFHIRNPEAPFYLLVNPSTEFLGLNVRSVAVRLLASH